MFTVLSITEALSDIILLLTLFVLQKANTQKSTPGFGARVIIAIIASCVLSFVFSSNIYTLPKALKLLVFLLNFSKFILLTLFVYKRISLKSIICSLIIQFISLSATFDAAVFVMGIFLPDKQLADAVSLLISRSIILIAIILLKKKNHSGYINVVMSIMPDYAYLLVFLSIFLSSGISRTVGDFILPADHKIQIVSVMTFLSAISIAAVIILFVTRSMAATYYRGKDMILEHQTESQLEHYKLFRKSINELQSFKHDYLHHMKYIRTMLSDGKICEVSEYLGKIITSFPVNELLYNTGNYAADAILSEKSRNADRDIQIKFNGKIPEEIDSSDLCVILSNALDNAIKASKLCDGSKTITVSGNNSKGYFILEIKNPVSSLQCKNDDLIHGKKYYVPNYGYGLANIRKTAHKYNGNISINCENSVFTIDISLLLPYPESDTICNGTTDNDFVKKT